MKKLTTREKNPGRYVDHNYIKKAEPGMIETHSRMLKKTGYSSATAAAWVPHRITSPSSKPAPVWAPQTWPEACWHLSFWWGDSLLWASIFSTMDLHGLYGHRDCLTTVFTTGYRESLLQHLENLFPLLPH